ncbi:uncharacterized protein C21orf58 homolog isoform X1 [Coturnix japonica]|uniref:uncharacterized protein C21orf58 homolog isoform X1 n=1 Tax=Coturnix japonica TaxID=93934 RepID=UPI0007780862|nr:uncharacterized protein C21orf58 homolog isoform X1 [Coturnix japonica]
MFCLKKNLTDSLVLTCHDWLSPSSSILFISFPQVLEVLNEVSPLAEQTQIPQPFFIEVLQPSYNLCGCSNSSVSFSCWGHELEAVLQRLENEQKNLEKIEAPLPTANNRSEDMLQSALKRRKNLLQELREQHLLEELSQPSAPARAQYRNYSAGPPHIYQIPFPAPQAETPRIIQQAMPPQPATIIQQLPQPPPLIAQIPTVQPFAHPRSGSIKEDMVEMMLMQNAQMHQIIMQNMMLKSLPPVAFAQPARPGCPPLQHTQQDLQISAPVAVKADRPWQSTVHHHHHYSPPGLPLHAVPAGLLMPGEGLPSASSSQRWTSSVLPAMQMWPTY